MKCYTCEKEIKMGDEKIVFLDTVFCSRDCVEDLMEDELDD